MPTQQNRTPKPACLTDFQRSVCFGGENMNLLKKQIAACLKVEELTNALKEIVKVKGQGCNAKSGRDDIHWLAITNFMIIVAHIFTVSNS